MKSYIATYNTCSHCTAVYVYIYVHVWLFNRLSYSLEIVMSVLQFSLLTAAKDEPLTLLNLTNELASVSEWYMLGIQLGVQPHQLEAIKTSSVSVGQKRAEMLHAWLKNSLAASWQNVVTALKAIGDVCLAETIEKKYPASPGESHA